MNNKIENIFYLHFEKIIILSKVNGMLMYMLCVDEKKSI